MDLCTSLVDVDGYFRARELEDFIKKAKMAECGLSYAVVSVMGPQSSGKKSTLLNHLFGTSFVIMDDQEAISQTRKGIWMARYVDIDPCTIVLDLEGSTGSERREDNITFGKHSVLFALAVSNKVLINIWNDNIDHEMGVNELLLKNVFKARMRLLSQRQISLIFVIHDKPKSKGQHSPNLTLEEGASPLSPHLLLFQSSIKRRSSSLKLPTGDNSNGLQLMVTAGRSIAKTRDSVPNLKVSNKSDSSENLEHTLRTYIEKIWDSVPYSKAGNKPQLSEFFNVEVAILLNYEDKEEVARLRQRFFQSIEPGRFAGDWQDVVPASCFSFSAEHIWKAIKETNKDLDLPAHKLMVVTRHCEKIAVEKHNSFVTNEEWIELEEAVQSNPVVMGFGEKISSMLNACLTEYDNETTYFEEHIKSAKRKQLKENILREVKPAYNLMLTYMVSRTLQTFQEAFVNASHEGLDCNPVPFMELFDEQYSDVTIKEANWEATKDKVKGELQSDIAQHIAGKLTKLFSEQMLGAASVPDSSFVSNISDTFKWMSSILVLPGVRFLFDSGNAHLAGSLGEDSLGSYQNLTELLEKAQEKLYSREA